MKRWLFALIACATLGGAVAVSAGNYLGVDQTVEITELEVAVRNPSVASSSVEATWSGITAGPGREPSVSVASTVYPDARGVQFVVNGTVDARCDCRPGGFDTTGPKDSSEFHIYPELTLAAGDVVLARWTDAVGTAHSSVQIVEGAAPQEPSPATPPAAPAEPPTEPSPPSVDPSGITHGSQLTENNTGLRAAGYVYNAASDTFSHPATGPLVASGTIRTEYDGQVIENVDVTGAIFVEHNNVTIRNCRVRYGGDQKAIDARSKSPVGTLIEFCDLTTVGNQPHEAYAIYLSRGTVRFVNAYRWQAAFIVGENTRIEYTRITDLRTAPGVHGTGGSADGGSNFVFLRNYIEGNTSASLALYARSPFDGVLVQDNFFDASTTPSYCFNGGDNKAGVGQNRNIKVINNIFGTTRYAECGQYGPAYSWDGSRPGAQWCSNRFVDGRRVGTDVGC